jgi:hypothetical protein
MRPTALTRTVDEPREQVFNYLSDLANYVEFTDHFLEDFRLERLDSRGVGAAASFRVTSALARLPLAAPLASVWAEVVLVEAEPPHNIALEGHAGRRGRIAFRGSISLTTYGSDMTRVVFTVSSQPATASDRMREVLGGRLWLKQQCRRALRRLKWILEEGEPAAGAVRVAQG